MTPHFQHARLMSSRWTTSPFFQSGEWGSNPRCPASKAGGLPLAYPLLQWTAGESHPDFRLATAASSCWTSSPREVRPGLEPGLPRLPGRRAAATLPDLRVAESGFEPARERLMTPCWEPGSSPLRSTPGRTRTCDDCLFVREVPSPLGYGGVDPKSERRRQESNLLDSRVAADRLAVQPRRHSRTRAGGGTRTHLVRVTRAVPGLSSIAGRTPPSPRPTW